MNPAEIPRPQSEADYAACYDANLIESRGLLFRALVRFRSLKRAQQITERVEGGFIFASPDAAKVYGEVMRHRSDVDHWHLRLTQARENIRREGGAPEREPGADDDVPIPLDRRLPPEVDE